MRYNKERALVEAAALSNAPTLPPPEVAQAVCGAQPGVRPGERRPKGKARSPAPPMPRRPMGPLEPARRGAKETAPTAPAAAFPPPRRA